MNEWQEGKGETLFSLCYFLPIKKEEKSLFLPFRCYLLLRSRKAKGKQKLYSLWMCFSGTKGKDKEETTRKRLPCFVTWQPFISTLAHVGCELSWVRGDHIMQCWMCTLEAFSQYSTRKKIYLHRTDYKERYCFVADIIIRLPMNNNVECV